MKEAAVIKHVRGDAVPELPFVSAAAREEKVAGKGAGIALSASMAAVSLAAYAGCVRK